MKTGPRLIIADDHPLMAQGLRALLAHDCDILALVHDSRELIGVLASHQPDVLLLDLSMPHLNGLEALNLIQARFPRIRVVVVTVHVDGTFADLAFEKGALGFVPKTAPVEELRAAIASATKGLRYLSPSVSQRRVRSGDQLQAEFLGCLTPRQREILRLLGEARTSTAIAGQLGISARTVAFHRAQIRRALGITTELGLVEYAVATRLSQEHTARADLTLGLPPQDISRGRRDTH